MKWISQLSGNHRVLLTLTAFAFACYGRSFNFGFILDDSFQILTNRLVQDFSRFFDHFAYSTVDQGGENPGAGIYYKPIMMIAYSIFWKLTPNDPFAFRFFQLLIHALNSYMVYHVIRTLNVSKSTVLLPLAAGCIFLVHPINSEAVLFIADLQEPLYTFFGLLGLITVMWYNSARSVALAGFFFLCSLLSKETGFLYSVLGISYAFFIKPELFKKLFVSLSIVGLTYAGLRFGLANLNALHSNTMQISRADLVTRLMTMPKVLIHYIHLFFYPAKISLTQDWIVSQMTLRDFWLPLAQVIAILAASIAYFFKTKNKIFGFFFLWFLLGWGLHSQIIPLDGTVSDRWFYFTIIGLLGMFSVILGSYTFRALPAAVVALGIIIGLTVRTQYRVNNWESPEALYTHDVTIDPDSFYLNNNLALEYIAQKKYDEAIPYLEKTISLVDEKTMPWYVAQTNLGSAYFFKRDYVSAEKHLLIALNYNDIKPVRAYLGLLIDSGRTDEARAFLTKARDRYPQDPVIQKLSNFVR